MVDGAAAVLPDNSNGCGQRQGLRRGLCKKRKDGSIIRDGRCNEYETIGGQRVPMDGDRRQLVSCDLGEQAESLKGQAMLTKSFKC